MTPEAEGPRPTSFEAGPWPQVQVSEHLAEQRLPPTRASGSPRMRTGPVCCVAFCMSNAQTPHLLYEARCRPSRFLLRHVPGWSLSPLHAGRHGDPGRLGRLSGEAAPGRGPQCANPTPAQVQPLTRPSPWFQHSHPRARRTKAAAQGPPPLWEANAGRLDARRTTVLAWGSVGPAQLRANGEGASGC